MFAKLLKREIIILATLNLLSANAFNLVKPKILFGKELTVHKGSTKATQAHHLNENYLFYLMLKICMIFQLEITKTADNKLTFLHVLAEAAHTKFPELIAVGEDLTTVPLASKCEEMMYCYRYKHTHPPSKKKKP